LGKRGLYRSIGGQAEEQVNELALLWVLNLSDGEHTLLTLQINQILVLMQSKGSRCPVKTRFIEIKPEGALVEGKNELSRSIVW